MRKGEMEHLPCEECPHGMVQAVVLVRVVPLVHEAYKKTTHLLIRSDQDGTRNEWTTTALHTQHTPTTAWTKGGCLTCSATPIGHWRQSCGIRCFEWGC